MTKWCFRLSVFSFVVLSATAVWLGALNQDEGWYVYAARLVGEGKMPYRDFFYTQGPLLPLVYCAFSFCWENWGLLGARVLTWVIGAASVLFAVGLARRLVSPEKRAVAGLTAFLLLGSNLYHLYYVSIPKTYALAALFAAMGFFNLTFIREGGRKALAAAFASGACLAFAAGARISLGALLALSGLYLVFSRRYLAATLFALGGFLVLGAVYGPFLLDGEALEGLIAAQKYHTARGGFDIVFSVGSVSRLVRWYLPLFVIFGLGVFCGGFSARSALPIAGFAAVFALQMSAPFPYEDYQVPVMGLMAAAAAAMYADMSRVSPLSAEEGGRKVLLALGLAFAASFGSPLLERWTTDGQDRFWTLKKEKSELAQLRDTARRIEAIDPGGKDILTQDLYLAVETGRKVPEGLEMGPFSMLTDGEWRRLLKSAPCRIAALSGYSFAVNPPKCDETPVAVQMKYWQLLKERYELEFTEKRFGQNQTTLLVLRRKETETDR
jgi:hypothetical protein